MPESDTQLFAWGHGNRFLFAPTVLIVDDNVQNVELFHAFLSELQVKVLTACDGVGALEKVEQHNPDLILLDVMMPRMSGFQVCRKLKSNAATRNIPILMITALNEPGDMETCREAGADEYVSKPVNRLDLLARVKRLLGFRD